MRAVQQYNQRYFTFIVPIVHMFINSKAVCLKRPMCIAEAAAEAVAEAVVEVAAEAAAEATAAANKSSLIVDSI